MWVKSADCKKHSCISRIASFRAYKSIVYRVFHSVMYTSQTQPSGVINQSKNTSCRVSFAKAVVILAIILPKAAISTWLVDLWHLSSKALFRIVFFFFHHGVLPQFATCIQITSMSTSPKSLWGSALKLRCCYCIQVFHQPFQVCHFLCKFFIVEGWLQVNGNNQISHSASTSKTFNCWQLLQTVHYYVPGTQV